MNATIVWCTILVVCRKSEHCLAGVGTSVAYLLHVSFHETRNIRSFLLMPSANLMDESSSSRSMQYFKMLLGTSMGMSEPSGLDSIGRPSRLLMYRLRAGSSGVSASMAKGRSASTLWPFDGKRDPALAILLAHPVNATRYIAPDHHGGLTSSAIDLIRRSTWPQWNEVSSA